MGNILFHTPPVFLRESCTYDSINIELQVVTWFEFYKKNNTINKKFLMAWINRKMQKVGCV